MTKMTTGAKLADTAERFTRHARANDRRRGISSLALVVAILLTTLSAAAFAERATDGEPLELRKIMRELGRNMQVVTDAISREDWARVAAVAPAIAAHPQPPMGEKLRILSFVGTNVPRFREFDGQTHHAANRMAGAATRKDGAGVITAFAEIQSGCLGCHQAFRKAFVEHFYGQQ